MRLGIFGGSFNPPHFGHLLGGVCALASGEIDRLLVVPAFRHPFGKDLAAFDDRFQMCRLAFADLLRTEVSRIEEHLGGESRTLYTLRALKDRDPAARLRLIVGADVLTEAEKWFGFAEIVQEAPLFVLGRSGVEPAPPDSYPPLPAISATEVRARVARGEPIDRLVPAAVAAYVQEHHLYRG